MSFVRILPLQVMQDVRVVSHRGVAREEQVLLSLIQLNQDDICQREKVIEFVSKALKAMCPELKKISLFGSFLTKICLKGADLDFSIQLSEHVIQEVAACHHVRYFLFLLSGESLSSSRRDLQVESVKYVASKSQAMDEIKLVRANVDAEIPVVKLFCKLPDTGKMIKV